jgi:Na+-transporting methylmalonyl-CoA/oxaloacetate decarboxylase gamma subunit
MDTGQSVLQLAGTTAAIGMGVVFAALFLLSLYMHYFKIFIGRIEAGHSSGQLKAQKAAAALKLDPVPVTAELVDDPAAQVAAAVAVGLRLRGLGGAPGGAPGGDVAAAIAAALAMHRAHTRAPSRASPAGAPWQMAGRLEMMGARVRRQER